MWLFRNRELEKRIWALENPKKFLKGDIAYKHYAMLEDIVDKYFYGCRFGVVDSVYVGWNNNKPCYFYSITTFCNLGIQHETWNEDDLHKEPRGEIRNLEYFKEFRKMINEIKCPIKNSK